MAAKKRKTLTLKRKTPKRKESSVAKAIADLHAEHRADVARIIERLDAMSGATRPDDNGEEQLT